MFNTSEHLFASQSLLNEQRRVPTGGLSEACKSQWEEGFPCPRPLEWCSKWALKPLLFDFPLPEENDCLLVWEELPP